MIDEALGGWVKGEASGLSDDELRRMSERQRDEALRADLLRRLTDELGSAEAASVAMAVVRDWLTGRAVRRTTALVRTRYLDEHSVDD